MLKVLRSLSLASLGVLTAVVRLALTRKMTSMNLAL